MEKIGKKTLTVFTPTYNRAYLLPRLYESLCCQTLQDFVWLVIDDGSSDNTCELIKSFQTEDKISVEYIYKENGGMHTAHNTAFDCTQTEIIMCVDSDDILRKNAVELIIKRWQEVSCLQEFAGVVADCAVLKNGEILGTALPKHIKAIKFYDIYYRYHVKGDKLLAYNTKLIKPDPYPSFENEKFVALDIKYLNIDKLLAIIHTPLMEKEYQPGGYTHNIPIVYTRNPRGFLYYHIFRMKKVENWNVKIKSIIHYIACSKLLNKKRIIKNSPYSGVTWLLYPLGCLWYCRLKSIKVKIQQRKLNEL